MRSSVHTYFRAQPEPLDTNLPSIEEIEAELCEGADEVVRHWMRKLRTRRIALLSAPTAREGWTTFDHQGTAENGWQIYTGDLDGRPQTMKLCPNFALYYAATPKQLHFTARKAKEIPATP